MSQYYLNQHVHSLTPSSYFEEHPNVQFNQESTCVIGLGVGLLSAAAIASSQTLINLLSIAVETVRIAFRTGVTTDRVSRQTQEHKSSHLSWSMNISDVSAPTVANELDSFYEVNVCTSHSVRKTELRQL